MSLTRLKHLKQFMGVILERYDRVELFHAEKTAALSRQLAERAGVAKADLDNLETAAFIHDFGKLVISPFVLRTPGPLSDAEMDMVRLHTTYGYDMFREFNFSNEVEHIALPVLRHHHENWDGSGYPDKLIREEIPLPARIVRIADSFEVMTDRRAYRKVHLDITQAIQEIGKGNNFYDPDLLKLFSEMMKE